MTGDGPGSSPRGLWESLWAGPFPLPALSFFLGKMGRGRLTWTPVHSPWSWDVWSAVHRHYCLKPSHLRKAGPVTLHLREVSAALCSDSGTTEMK